MNALDGDWHKASGILNNPTYAGQLAYGRTTWTRSNRDSNKRTPITLPRDKWILHNRPDLRIVPDELWQAVLAIQTEAVAATGRGKRRAVASGDRRAGYWLSSIIVCSECGSNYAAYGRDRYICGAHITGRCANALTFKRDETHGQLFEVLKKELMTPERVRQAQVALEVMIRDREQASRKRASQKVSTAEVDAQIAQVRNMGLSGAATVAAVRELEREKAGLIAANSGKTAGQFVRARKLVAALPDFAGKLEAAIRGALTATRDTLRIARARELTRALIQGGRIELAPVAAGDAVAGRVALLGLGAEVLRPVMATERQPRPIAGARRAGTKAGIVKSLRYAI
jgi:hypothetical protein